VPEPIQPFDATPRDAEKVASNSKGMFQVLGCATFPAPKFDATLSTDLASKFGAEERGRSRGGLRPSPVGPVTKRGFWILHERLAGKKAVIRAYH
jgi:hypothetical protein